MRDIPKDPNRVEAGRRAMRKRWGPQRVVRLDSLDADTARLIRALLAQTEKAPTPTVNRVEAQEARRGDDEPLAA
jgi:hypothetical protein